MQIAKKQKVGNSTTLCLNAVYKVLAFLPVSKLKHIDKRCLQMAQMRSVIRIQRSVKQWYRRFDISMPSDILIKKYLPIQSRSQVAAELVDECVEISIMLERAYEFFTDDIEYQRIATGATPVLNNCDTFADACVYIYSLQDTIDSYDVLRVGHTFNEMLRVRLIVNWLESKPLNLIHCVDVCKFVMSHHRFADLCDYYVDLYIASS